MTIRRNSRTQKHRDTLVNSHPDLLIFQLNTRAPTYKSAIRDHVSSLKIVRRGLFRTSFVS